MDVYPVRASRKFRGCLITRESYVRFSESIVDALLVLMNE